MIYKHHIIPRHAGGDDTPSNIKLVTLEEHAEEHRILYACHGRWQDYVAWKVLSGQMKKEELNLTLAREGGRLTWFKKGNIPLSAFKKGNTLGVHRYKAGHPVHGGYQKGHAPTTGAFIVGHAAVNKGRVYPIVTCSVCGKEGGESSMKRWHFNNCRQGGV